METAAISVREYDVNLDLTDSPGGIWQEVVERESKTIAHVCYAGLEDFDEISFGGLTYWLFGLIYRLKGGPYVHELKALAKASHRSFGRLAIVNCSYEMSHLAAYKTSNTLAKLGMAYRAISGLESHEPQAFGCTAGVARVPGGPLIHVRTLDWPNKAMKQATCVFNFSKNEGRRRWQVVGITGMVGVLSGMIPGAYSATIDWAPPTASPSFDYGPTFLLRHVLETCDTYEEAVKQLSTTPLSVSTFFTVCGTKSACVIERTHNDHAVRDLEDGVLTQSNHFQSPRFLVHNDELTRLKPKDPLLGTTERRAEVLKGALLEKRQASKSANKATWNDWIGVLSESPVTNDETVQRMIFCPAEGKLDLLP